MAGGSSYKIPNFKIPKLKIPKLENLQATKFPNSQETRIFPFTALQDGTVKNMGNFKLLLQNRPKRHRCNTYVRSKSINVA
jgi:hypothetical protein